MSRIIILNGPTGIGKSTIAARLHVNLPDSIAIDVDELRRKIPVYREHREESAKLAYEKAIEITEENLPLGKTIILEKAIHDPAQLDTFFELGRKHHAAVFEFILFADRESLQRRADERGYRPGSLLTREKVGVWWERINALREQRPDAIVIDTGSMDIDTAVATVETHLH